MLRVNKNEIKDPASITIEISDIDASADRNANGNLVRDRVATKYKLNMAWNALTDTEMADLLNAVEDEFFEVEFIDPKTMTYKTCTMYVGDRSTEMAYIRELDGSFVWRGLSMNFIEK